MMDWNGLLRLTVLGVNKGKSMMHFVICSSCGDKHKVDDVEFLNIEEGLRGEDIMTYKCPVTDECVQSFVYRKQFYNGN